MEQITMEVQKFVRQIAQQAILSTNTEQRRPQPCAPSKPACDICGGTGYYSLDVPFGDPRFGKLFYCQCVSGERSARLQAMSGMTVEERGVTLEDIIISRDTPNTLALVEAARDFISRPHGILTVWGTHGNAKSAVLCAVVNECVSRGIRAMYITWSDLVGIYQDSYDERCMTNEYGSAWNRFKTFVDVPVLAIDEMEKVGSTEARESLRINLLDARYRRGISGDMFGTLIAMNRRPDEVLDASTVSRLRDGRNVYAGHGPIIHNSDPDRRPKMREAWAS